MESDNNDGTTTPNILFSNVKKRGHGSRSWIQINQDGRSQIVSLDKSAIMRCCSLPGRDLRLLDPLFVYPSTILGREKAIVVNLEQIRCIITADKVIVMNSLDNCVFEYESELCKRLRLRNEQNVLPNPGSDDLPFEFLALELALEFACLSLDTQVTELEAEVYPVLDELASSISTLKLECVRRLKSHLLALTRRVQKVRDEIERLIDDDGDMAEMYLTDKKEMENHEATSRCFPNSFYERVSKSEPVSPIGSISGFQTLEKPSTGSIVMSLSRGSGSWNSYKSNHNIEELEMLLEAYFVVIDNTLNKLSSLKEYINDTEDFINIKLDNVRNQLIQLELLLTAATFVVAIFTVVTGVFGMNFAPAIFTYPSAFNWVLIITGISCGILYLGFLLYFRHKKLLFGNKI